MQIIKLSLLVVAPYRIFFANERHILSVEIEWFFRPYIIVAVFGIWIFSGLLKPGMLDGSVIDNQVDNNPDAQVVGPIDQSREIAQVAQTRIDLVVVRYVVTVVAVG